MKAVEDIEGAGAALTDDAQVRFPHIGADKLDLLGQILSDQGEELLEARHRALLADPQQAGALALDLVDQGEILVALGIRNLIDTDRLNRTQDAMFKAPGDHVFDCLADLLP